MIEPVRQGAALLDEIASTTPGPGSLVVWWLGQSGFLIKSRRGSLAVDPYLSEHLTKKYESTSRPHVRVTRAPVRGHELQRIDLVLASHKHSDHLDPGTIPDLLLASPGAVLVLPESIIDHAVQLGLPRQRLIGLDAGDTMERAGFRVHAIPSAHEGLDTD
jgi:L-ascorbate 6-phosphate lactonase